MRRRLLPWTLLAAAGVAAAAAAEPPAEVLADLDFFLNYPMVRDLDALVEGSTQAVRGSTQPVRSPAPAVKETP